MNILNPISLGLNITNNNNINKEITINNNTLYVGGTGPNNYTKIKDAINDASNGYTIFVYSGTYYEYIILYKSLNLIGENRETTNITCKDKTDVIKISANNVTIKGFTLYDAGQNFLYKTDAGIEISNNKNNITIEENIIAKGYCGILSQDSENVTIKNNILHTNNGPSIWFYGKSINNSIINNKITRKINDRGGGIWLEKCSSNILIKNNVFTNTGIFIFGYTIDHFTQEIQENTVNNKLLFYAINQKNLQIPDDAVNLILVNCSNSILNDKNATNAEAGILLAFSSNITINNSNYSSCNGGIALINVNNCIITNNSLTNIGDGIILRYSQNNIISNNKIFMANRLGVEVINSDNNYITKNTVSTNFSTRNIEILNSYDNHVYHNNFLVYKKNINYPYYIAVDTGYNQWDDGSLGNYWWDYEEKYIDSGNNGVTYEKSYLIDTNNNRDNHPLVNPIGITSNPPSIPNNIQGPKIGGNKVYYNFSTTTLDPDGDELYYLFDWGDGSNSGWCGPFDSGNIGFANKSWDSIGFYKIRVKSKDVYGFESEWSKTVRIIMPKTKQIFKYDFFELLQNLFNILKQL